MDRPRSYICEAAAWGSLPHDLRAIAFYHMGDYQQALEDGKKALALSPGDPRLRENVRIIEEKAGSGE